jgi:hypothetical protein
LTQFSFPCLISDFALFRTSLIDAQPEVEANNPSNHQERVLSAES